MSDASVIREYLVALGYKADEASWKKFDQSIKAVEKAMASLGAVVASTAAAVAIGAVEMADDLEGLYWASQRIGSSVDNIKAYGFALTQMGGSAQGAQSALEGIAKLIATNPGGESYLRALGVRTRDEKGSLRDAAELASDLGKAFAKMPVWRANLYAQQFGIDYNTMLAMRRGTDASVKQARDILRGMGVDYDKAALASMEFGRQLRTLKFWLDAALTREGLVIISQLLESLHQANEWLVRNSSQVRQLGADFDGLTTSVGGLVKTLSQLGGIDWSKGFLRFLHHLVLQLTDTVRALDALLHGDAVGAAKWLGQSIADSPLVAAVSHVPGPQAGAGGQNGQYAGTKGDFKSVADFFRSKGWSPAQAAGMAAGLGAESGLSTGARNPSSGAYGLAQWLGGRVRDFQKIEGIPLLGASMAKQLDFVQWELLHSRKSAGIAVGRSGTSDQALLAFLQMFEAPGSGLGGDMARGRRYLGGGGMAQSAVIHQKTDIHVNAAADPHATAKGVAAAQGRVNADLVRNATTKVQ